MSFRIGFVGLCTSHPECWAPIIRELSERNGWKIEIAAAWDSGETRQEGFAKEFCAKFEIPNAVEKLEDMLPLVDGVIVHTTNWDRHVPQAETFVKAGKSVYLDKPVAGNMRDVNTVLDWIKSGYRVTGGSVMRYCYEFANFLAKPESERGKPYTVYTSIGVDDYNYGIHGYATLSAILGKGVVSAQYVAQSNQKQIVIEWRDGRVGIITVGKTVWLPFNATVTTDRNVFMLPVDNSKIYEAMLKRVLPYFIGLTDTPPLSADELLEPELAAMAAGISWKSNGRKVYIADLRCDDNVYDGTQFATEYRRARFEKK